MNNFKLGTSVSTSSPTMRAIIFRIAKFVLMFLSKMMFLRRWRGSSIINYNGGGCAPDPPLHIYTLHISSISIHSFISLTTSLTTSTSLFLFLISLSFFIIIFIIFTFISIFVLFLTLIFILLILSSLSFSYSLFFIIS